MYIWVAVDVSEQTCELRKNAEKYVENKRLSSPTFTLPFHISLKIAFQVNDNIKDEVIDEISNFFKAIKPFIIEVKNIEKTDNIIWLTMKESEQLNYIHNKLDEILYEKFGVVQHEFDKAFIFHTSILIMDNKEEICTAFDQIKTMAIPQTFSAEKIIIGSSKSGKPSTYCVNEEIMF